MWYGALGGQTEGVGYHGTGVTDSCELLRGFKVCSPEEKPMLLTAEASLKPPHAATVVTLKRTALGNPMPPSGVDHPPV